MRIAIAALVLAAGCARSSRPEAPASRPTPPRAAAAPDWPDVRRVSPDDLGLDRSTTTVTIDAKHGRSIRGRVMVVAAGGLTPAAGATVILTGPAIPDALWTVADEDGHYSFKLLRDGDYAVTIYYSDVIVKRVGLRVTASTSTVVDAQLDDRGLWLLRGLIDPWRLPLPRRATADPKFTTEAHHRDGG